MENYINKLKNTYDVGKENKENFKFLGMKIRNIDKNLIKVEQNAYINELERIDL